MSTRLDPPSRRPRRGTPGRRVEVVGDPSSPDPAHPRAPTGAALDAVSALGLAGTVEAAVLLLLAQDAPTTELDRLIELADGDPRAGAAVRSALQVRALLTGHRRREQQLAALYETAGDLSSLREEEAVLQAIVRRARQLLGSDVAYLTLNDEQRGATYMRVTTGVETDSFKRLEIELGAGLGGLVAATCTPYATSDYGADERFVHTIDDVVTGEGLVAILGVPLRLGERAIGVLFAANRYARPFDREEVALLLSMGDHAAIAIENASLFQELSTALAELRTINDVVRAHSHTLERAAAVHERLSAVLLGGGGLREVACGVVDALGGTLLVADPSGRLLVHAGDSVPDERAEQLLAALGGHGRRGPRAVRTTGPGGEAVYICGALAGPDALGCLVTFGRDLGEAEVRILERASVVTALLLLQQRTVADAEQRVRGELFDELFAVPQHDPEGLHRRAAHLGADLRRPHVVAVARLTDASRAPAALRAAAQLHGPDGLVGQHRNDVVVLVASASPADPSAVAGRLSRDLAQATGCPVTVGAAGPGVGAADLADLHRDAVRCVDVLAVLGRDGEGAGVADLGVHGLLLGVAGRAELDRFVSRTLGPLLDWDRERGSDLAGTLLTWYACGGNLTRTAAELFVHVNTLYQRLDRVTVLIGPEWRTGDTALQVHLALTVSRAFGTVR